MDLHSDTVSTISDTTEAGFESIVDLLYADSPNTWWESMVLPQLRSYTSQMTTLIINYPLAIGAFFDAQSQQDSITRMQVLSAKTTRDHMPAVSMCEFATLSKSLVATKIAKDNMVKAMSLQNLKRVTLDKSLAGSKSVNEDAQSRFEQFKAKYCFSTPQASDHAGLLEGICTATAGTRKNNIDINFTQLLGAPKTISATLYPANYGSNESRSQFEDIVALSRNLYGDTPTEAITENNVKKTTEGLSRLQLIKKRTLQAKRNVAQHSFANYVGLKAPTDKADDSSLSITPHMQNLLLALGLDGSAGNEFSDYFAQTGGPTSLSNTSPSYWAQMEVLTKTLYQNPRFFVNLYDNPANVKRQQAAMKAIDLMQERDIHETALRSETLLSLWLDSALEDYGQNITQEWANMKAAKE
tara:strand:- start:366363 stop:367601 length:1239 start_codon:yes stop_codon:yes gene_type:complete